jgi:hypothetical protein
VREIYFLYCSCCFAILPVPITRLVSHAPHYIAAADASHHGMVGFWLPSCLATDAQLYICHVPRSPLLSKALITPSNPMGPIKSKIKKNTKALLHTLYHAFYGPIQQPSR